MALNHAAHLTVVLLLLPFGDENLLVRLVHCILPPLSLSAHQFVLTEVSNRWSGGNNMQTTPFASLFVRLSVCLSIYLLV